MAGRGQPLGLQRVRDPVRPLLASKHERGPGIEQGEELEAAEVPDRAAAIALAHQYLDKHAEEAAGRTSLEIHIRPPATELRDPELYEVPPEIVAQARRLGLKGDVAAQIKRMVWGGRPEHRRAEEPPGRPPAPAGGAQPSCKTRSPT